jgi:hypothetical protein
MDTSSAHTGGTPPRIKDDFSSEKTFEALVRLLARQAAREPLSEQTSPSPAKITPPTENEADDA